MLGHCTLKFKEKDILDFVVACASADDGAILDKVLLKFTAPTPEASV